MATGVAARCARDARCRQCTGKRLSRTIWSSFHKERMSHLCDSTVAGPTARRDNALASKCEYPPFRYPPFTCALKVRQYTSNLYGNTPPRLYRRAFLVSKLRRKGNPAIRLPFCTAVCLPFVRQYAPHMYGSAFGKIVGLQLGVTRTFLTTLPLWVLDVLNCRFAAIRIATGPQPSQIARFKSQGQKAKKPFESCESGCLA